MAILIALGSNRPHGQYGRPERVLAAAVDAIEAKGIETLARSGISRTAPLGPSQRRYANMVVEVTTTLSPEALLETLQEIEAAFGRRRWRRWGDRVLDLDLISYDQQVRPTRLAWPGAGEAGRALILPHPRMHERRFVLDPALDVAPGWRHPVLGLTIRQMHARLAARR